MIIRNGILSNLRAKGRTALFCALIFALTVSLTLGMGMWAYCGEMLAKCDESYTSVALVEYMGAEYPDEDVADDFARAAFDALDNEAIAGVEGVTLWERADRTLATVEGYRRNFGTMPYEDMGVVVAKTLSKPIYETKIIALTREELAETCVIWDWINGELVIHDGGAEIDRLPVYFFSPWSEGYAWQRYDYKVHDDGSVTMTERVSYRMEETLPEEYIAHNVRSGLNTVVYNGALNLLAPELPLYQYDESMGVYYREEQVIAAFDALVSKSVYTLSGRDSALMVMTPGETGFEPEPGVRYLFHGQFYDTGLRGGEGFQLVDIYEGCDTPPYVALTQENEHLLTEGPFAEAAEKYRLGNNYIRLEASADVGSLEVFQQGTLYLTEGRFPRAGEAGAAVLSGHTAVSLGVELGDTIPLTTLDSDESDRFTMAVTGDTRQLTVVGITISREDYDGCIWVSDAEGGFEAPLYGYQLGRIVLDNNKARQAVERLQTMMPDQVRVTLYDQGYSAAAQPLQTMQTTAFAITLASAAGALAVLVLFAFLFVGRQRDTVQILTSLGTPKRKVTLWLLSGATVISGAAALLGGVLGGGVLDKVIRMALEAAQGLYQTDLRYSEAAVGLRRELEYTVEGLVWPAAVSGAAVFAAALLLCALFLRQARRQDTPKKGKLKVRTPKGGTSVAGRGVLRFAWRGARRGGTRSCVVPAAALVLALFLGILGSTAQSWERQVDALYEGTTISAQGVSINGRHYSRLTIPGETLRLLNDSGLVEQIATSEGYHYWSEGEMPQFGTGSYGRENRQEWIDGQPELIALNSLSAAPEFYYAQPQVTWLEGWDETVLASGDYKPFYDGYYPGGSAPEVYPALASQTYMEQRGLTLGDTLTVSMSYDLGGIQDLEGPVKLMLVGSFVQQSPDANLYIPLAFVMDPADLFGEDNPFADLDIGDRKILSAEIVGNMMRYYTRFNTCRFVLKSAYDLEEMRDFLQDNKFSLVNTTRTVRTAVVLEDASFTETVGGLGRYIAFGRILFPILLMVVGVLGFIISWLMINSRRMEFAIMRGLGAPKGTVFLTFFVEQGLLCLIGCGAACLVLPFLPGGGGLRWLAVGLFLVCYLAGCALSVLVVGRTKLMSLLSERE